MGGHAFESATAEGQPMLNTPRMTPSQYAQLKDLQTKALEQSFPGCRVAVLKEAPGKTSYGDIDFIVCSDVLADWDQVARDLGAAGLIRSNRQCTFAVPKDGTRHDRPPVRYKIQHKVVDATRVTSQEYAQIDVDEIPSHLFQWHLFYSSYGDVSTLLGRILYNLGFTMSNQGLLLRLEELDHAKELDYVRVADQQGKMLLSIDPDSTMDFLGLSAADWHAGFITVEDLYTWLAKCKFITPDMAQYKRNIGHSQRKQIRKRENIHKFFDEYLPAHFGLEPLDGDSGFDSGSGTSMNDTCAGARDEVSLRSWKQHIAFRRECAQLAVRYFSKQDEHEALQRNLTFSIQNQRAEYLVKPLIALHSGKTNKKLTELVRSFRRWVTFDRNGNARVAEFPHSDESTELRRWLRTEADNINAAEAVKDLQLRDEMLTDEWVRTHWEELQRRERESRRSILNDDTDDDNVDGDTLNSD